MPVLELPVWLRMFVQFLNTLYIVLILSSIFLVLTVASFIPQLHRTIFRKQSSGMSTNYLLFNLISATEQFAFTFFHIVDSIREDRGFHREPVTVGNWIDLTQTVVVLLYWLTLYAPVAFLPFLQLKQHKH